MSDYSDERDNIIKKMANISRDINLSRSRIKSEKQEIKNSEECIYQQQQMIDAGEIELIYLMEQLKQEFQE